jgi:hypothetical protein
LGDTRRGDRRIFFYIWTCANKINRQARNDYIIKSWVLTSSSR